MNPLVSQPARQPVSQKVKQAVSQSVSQWVNQSTRQSVIQRIWEWSHFNRHTCIINIGFVRATKTFCLQCVFIHIELFNNNIIKLVPPFLCIAAIHPHPVCITKLMVGLLQINTRVWGWSFPIFSRVHNKFFRTSLGKYYHGTNGIRFVQLGGKKGRSFPDWKCEKWGPRTPWFYC